MLLHTRDLDRGVSRAGSFVLRRRGPLARWRAMPVWTLDNGGTVHREHGVHQQVDGNRAHEIFRRRRGGLASRPARAAARSRRGSWARVAARAAGGGAGGGTGAEGRGTAAARALSSAGSARRAMIRRAGPTRFVVVDDATRALAPGRVRPCAATLASRSCRSCREPARRAAAASYRRCRPALPAGLARFHRARPPARAIHQARRIPPRVQLLSAGMAPRATPARQLL